MVNWVTTSCINNSQACTKLVEASDLAGGALIEVQLLASFLYGQCAVFVQGICHPYEKEAILNRKDQKRLMVLNEMMTGRMIGQKTAETVEHHPM